ncbi:hypothetical protein TBLA_0H03100 [Henningerozyma blattae CBS 6284]|uniref:Cell wall mannoprotein PIR1-like C-terminal domain-containing protein n=1 Tax=Henningerozyma blattae (strain ATCC 34711 / CBS 6284 / DSM 70876 / NBRC 10599 / NRRL Y-10934 / UCD 77-7) TaxID=1071380 RepID=I2H889_HENB6|nr:hypothetical protein TBLA_0H03100 [Tetrapisispora blattae CBS 6284]CCH62591.1 hypothetical protein TBLA_0H03100 [Tetrapisispora blattae CBS 6284]
MQYKNTLAIAALASSAMAAYKPSEPWSTLTPDSKYANAMSDYTGSFGIAVVPMTASTAKAKRDAVSQIGDGQIQAATTTTKTEAPKQTAAAVSQIGDGQIQATTKTEAPKQTAAAVSQIGDGQIQATTKTEAPKQTAAAVSQIGDGQIQATTRKTTTLDGKSFSATATKAESTTSTASTSSAQSSEDAFFESQACKNNGTLTMTLKNGILTDAKGRVGSIVSNRQFQFDGPPPQAGAIYAAGWSITPKGNLAIGSNDVFYQCLSGNFYNLYDENQGEQCTKVYLQAVELVSC